MIELYNGDCLDVMKQIPDKSVDMVLCDLPYGTTSCSWDIIIPFEPLWEQYKRITKENSAIVLFGSEPFSSALRMSNIKNYKYDWVWNKKQTGNPFLAKKQPLKIHENIMVFNTSFYEPIMRVGKMRIKGGSKHSNIKVFGGTDKTKNNLYYPTSILDFPNCATKSTKLHPTQKPVALCEYLIKTYTNEGDLVLDNCAGSMTTGIACQNLNRNCILIEKDKKYFGIGKKRLYENKKSWFDIMEKML